MDATPEEWRPVVGWEDLYEVSDQGRVRSLDRTTHFTDGRVRFFPGQLLTLYRSPGKARAYPRVELRRAKQHRTVNVHVLVLEAFVGPRPDGMNCCHWNDDPTDNRLSNLRWDTTSANQHDQVRNGRHANMRKTHCPQGHAYSPENLINEEAYRRRRCRECHNADGRRRYHEVRTEMIKRSTEAKA
ncbi:MAG: NUMOD4 motif-containing HNH endonuclease [Nitrospiraceae bacterium]|nr:NUMOD4 motif-containing HNH endonuclease [Nitrospiraceae bacterium]